MKKLMVLVLAMAVVMSFSAVVVAQDTSSGMGKDDKAAAAPLKTLRGKIGDDGKSFVAADGKSWTIMNPEAVKGHEGHDVSVKAHVYKDKDQIHVMSVKMAKAEKKADKM